MALDIDLDALKDNLFDAAEEAGKAYFDTAKEKYSDYKDELRVYTDNLAVLKKEIAEAPADLKQIKADSILIQQRSINSLVDKYQMIMVNEASEQLKEVLQTVAMTVGKIAMSMLIAAVWVDLVTPLELSTSGIVDNIFPDETPYKPTKVAEVASAMVDTAMIEKAADETIALFKDGFQTSDIFPALSRLMEMAEIADGASGEEKKELVIQGAKRIYEKLNPDIAKWIPQWVEKKAVNWALETMLPYAVDWAVGLTKGKLNVNKPSD